MSQISLEIHFLDYENEFGCGATNKSSFIFLNEEIKITKKMVILNINQKEFNEREDYIVTSIKLKLSNKQEYEANFKLYYGKNKMYCYIKKNYYKNSYELIFHNLKEKISKIKIGKDEIDKGDRFDDTNIMERFLIINPIENKINILEQDIALDEYTEGLSGNSFQMSFYSVKEKKIVVQEINKEGNETLIELLKLKKDNFLKVYELSLNLVEEYKYKDNSSRETFEIKIKPILKELEEQNNIIMKKDQNNIKNENSNISLYVKNLLNYSLNISNKILEKQFPENEDIYLQGFSSDPFPREQSNLELFFHFLIWHCYLFKYYISSIKNIQLFIQYIQYMDIKKKEIFNDTKLKKYQKVKLLKFYSVGLENHYNSQEGYINTIIGHYFFHEMDKDSILNKSLEVVKYISSNLTEKSALFFPLLLLNSGIGYINKEKTYSFSILSPKMIRQHLKELIPDLIILYYNDNEIIYGETEKSHGIISINIKKTFPKIMSKENFSILFQPMNKNPFYLESNDLANSVILFIHELCGHNKLIYQKNCSLKSPKKFYNRNFEFIEMIDYNSNKEGDQYYKCLSQYEIDGNKGESGQFIEYFFGFCEFGKNTRLLPLCKKIDGLFSKNNLHYWVDDLNFFKKYVEFKFLGTILETTNFIKMNIIPDNLEKEIIEIQEVAKKEKPNVDNLIRKYLTNCNFPEKKKKISENEHNIFLNYLSGDAKAIMEELNDLGFLENNMVLKCK